MCGLGGFRVWFKVLGIGFRAFGFWGKSSCRGLRFRAFGFRVLGCRG